MREKIERYEEILDAMVNIKETSDPNELCLLQGLISVYIKEKQEIRTTTSLYRDPCPYGGGLHRRVIRR